MTTLVLVVAALVVCCPLVGRYLAAVFTGNEAQGDRIVAPIENMLFPAAWCRPEATATVA